VIADLLGLRVVGSPGPASSLAFTALVLFNSMWLLRSLRDSAVFLALAYVGILWSLQTDQDELAARLPCRACACGAGLPFLILVTWRVFHESRWRILPVSA
jgi:hypothetical protein